MKVKTCTKCGGNNTMKSKKCFNCGAPLTVGGKLDVLVAQIGVAAFIGFLAYKYFIG